MIAKKTFLQTKLIILVAMFFFFNNSALAQIWDYEIEARNKKAEKEANKQLKNYKDTVLLSYNLQEKLDSLSQKEFQQKSIQLINTFRKDYFNILYKYNPYFPIKDSVRILKHNDELASIAEKHAKYLYDVDMPHQVFISEKTGHIGRNGEDCWDRAKIAGYKNYDSVSENLAYNYTNFKFIRDWIDSPMHFLVLLAVTNMSRDEIGIYRYKNVIVLLIAE
ncbi:MAG: CAP domain-containing protein [Salinivirgaceae bacterium]|nr:CAP domain-containing protein [Salinivirgaceae bacterium]